MAFGTVIEGITRALRVLPDTPVAHIEDDAALLRFKEVRQHMPLLVQHRHR